MKLVKTAPACGSVTGHAAGAGRAGRGAARFGEDGGYALRCDHIAITDDLHLTAVSWHLASYPMKSEPTPYAEPVTAPIHSTCKTTG